MVGRMGLPEELRVEGLELSGVVRVVSDRNELMRYTGDLTRAGSEAEKAYRGVLGISKSVMNKLLKVFRQSVLPSTLLF
ncbi:hypothetical protein HS088_TW13G01185 [Tripterygium wilfordii]|uniref:Uncharacterized protein n=1 Tax=Tripterygium wilfordii TaxID=458696 RepID=A0A7J7CWH1_TRIWF|nr:hypothetical protein HS088_TW13G01185 [Tripterygium wilfordii]